MKYQNLKKRKREIYENDKNDQNNLCMSFIFNTEIKKYETCKKMKKMKKGIITMKKNGLLIENFKEQRFQYQKKQNQNFNNKKNEKIINLENNKNDFYTKINSLLFRIHKENLYYHFNN